MNRCLDNADFERFRRGQLSDQEVQQVSEHLFQCPSCQTAFRALTPADPLVPSNDKTIRLDAQGATESIRGFASDDTSPAARTAPLLPRIEGYRITGVLGQGGMGVVYRAVQTKLNRAVALKVLPAIVGSASPAAVARFRREATSAARLHHTHIVPIYDFGECRDAYYYAMELIEGQPLNVLIKTFAEHAVSTASPARLADVIHASTSGATPQQSDHHGDRSTTSSGAISSSTGRNKAYYHQVAQWMADAADALHYAHGEGIIHRDIKPGNLILSTDGRIMITDFGLAKSTHEDSVTITGSLLGTVRYLSPEQAMAKRIPVDHRTDVYSLGATMYELLTFQPAFLGPDEKQILAAIITRDPPPPRKIATTVPPELETICLKTLEKSPDARYATAKAFSEDLRRYLNDLPIAAKRPGPVRRFVKFVRRRRAVVSAAVAAVALAATLTFSYFQGRARHAEDINRRIADARLAEREELWNKAETIYREALDRDPRNALLLGNLARTLQEKIDRQPSPSPQLIDEALGYCEQALRLENNSRLRNVYGVLLGLDKQYDQAISVFQGELKAAPEAPYLLINLAAVEFMRGDFAKAQEYLRRSTKHTRIDEKTYCHGWRELATLQLYLDSPEAAASMNEAFQCGAALENVPWYYLVKARLCLTRDPCNDLPLALADARLADGFARRKDPTIKRYLALALLRNGLWDEAVTEAQNALRLGDLAAFDHLVIALARAYRGDRAAAEEALHKADADAAWPADLREPGQSYRTQRLGILWFESADELLALRREVTDALEQIQ